MRHAAPRSTGRRRLAMAAPIAALAALLAAPALPAGAASTVPIGGYSGTSDAYNGATVAFEIDGDGRMSEFWTESYLFCDLFPTPIQWAEQPPLEVTAGVPFTQEWTFSDVDYELSGVISANGEASGTGVATMMDYGCSGFEFTWTASADDPVVIDPDLTVSPAEVTVSELADPGITIAGTGFAPNSDVSLTVGGIDGGTLAAGGDGDVSFTFATASLAPGTHTVNLTSAEGTANGSLTVTEDPVVIDPEVTVTPTELTVSELVTGGIVVSGTGFAPASDVTLTVGGADGGTQTTNATGDVEFAFTTSELAPGTYDVILSSADGSASTTVTVLEDPVVIEPFVSVDTDSITLSELALDGIVVTGSGFVPNSTVTLTVGGIDGGNTPASDIGEVEFTFTTSELAPDTHDVVLSSADGSASTTVTVLEDPVVVEPELTVSPSEVTVSELADPGIAIAGTGFASQSDVALTVGDVDGGTQTTNTAGDVEFAFATSDLAAGTYDVILSSSEGNASGSLTVTEDPVVVDPQLTVSPEAVTVSALADPGVVVTGTGFAPGTSVELTVGDVDGGTGTTDENGVVELTFRSGEFVPGTYDVTLASADGTASGALTVTQDDEPGLPEQIPSDVPSADDLNETNRDGITGPGTAVEGTVVDIEVHGAAAGDAIGVWLFSTPTYLGTVVVPDDLVVSVVLPADVTGEHRIAVYALDESVVGWDELTISPAGGGNPAPAPSPGTDGEEPPSDDDSRRLAETGTEAVGLGAAVLLVGVGAVLALLGIRRRRSFSDS